MANTVTAIHEKRSAEVRVKLLPSIHAEFEEQCRLRGVLPATHAATVIGEWLATQKRQQELQRLTVLEMSRQMGSTFSDPSFMAQVMAQLEGMGIVLPEEGGGLAGKAESSAAPQAAASADGCAAGAPAGEDRARSAT